MKKIYITLLAAAFILNTNNILYAQSFCQTGGNVVIFSNYDAGILNINVDMNILNLKIGIVSYENDSVVFSGPYVSNITKVIYAGFYNSSNVHCPNQPVTKTITGAPAGTDTVIFIPAATLSNPYGYLYIICNYSCDDSTSQGGCNTPDQITDYFFQQFGSSALLFHKTQYGCWTGTQNISTGGNCCIVPSGTGIEEIAANNFSILPNAGSGIFELSVANSQLSVAAIYNLAGEKCYSAQFFGKTKIDLSGQPKGIYLYKVFSENHFVANGKLVIQ